MRHVPDRPRITLRRVARDAAPDDPIVRSLRRHARTLGPDPRFERRLRGIVLSRHVAAREGYRVPPPRRTMTPIGRGVLLSTVLLAISATAVGAASAGALPDDPLYPVKLQIEELRLAVAPADLRDEVMLASLEERIEELTALAEAGRWSSAEEAAWRVAQTERELDRVDGLAPGVAARLHAHLEAVRQIMAHAPSHAREVVRENLDPTRASLDRTVAEGANGGRGGDGAGPASPTRTPRPSPATPPSRGSSPGPRS